MTTSKNYLTLFLQQEKRRNEKLRHSFYSALLPFLGVFWSFCAAPEYLHLLPPTSYLYCYYCILLFVLHTSLGRIHSP